MAALPIILYEGAEDHAFFSELLNAFGLSEKFVFHLNKHKQPDCAGKDGFGKILSGLIGETHKAIIIVADNDGHPTEAFKNIQKQIGEAGFTIPQKPREKVETKNMPPLSVLMIPWDNELGCLETLCLGAANQKYKTQLDCADGLVKCAGADGWPLSKQAKLRMRGFLSAVCKLDPNTGLRYAWCTKERPGDIFPMSGVATYNQIVEYFKGFTA
jgi:hypothetical protein